MNDLNIILPPQPKDFPESVKQKNRAMFTNDYEREGILAKVFVFTKISQPTTKNELQQKLQEYYGTEFDKDAIGRALKKLEGLGLLKIITSGELVVMDEDEMDDMQKTARAKFFKFLQHIPSQFKKNYNAMGFYSMTNGLGIEYIPWCCKLLGFQFKENNKNG